MPEEENKLVCDDCKQSKPDVKETFCPYSEEINDEKVPVTLCDNCYYERCMAI